MDDAQLTLDLDGWEGPLDLLLYLIKKDDCETMARAYVNDISQFLDVTNKENVKILKGKTLI